jgi:hypothetical protein
VVKVRALAWDTILFIVVTFSESEILTFSDAGVFDFAANQKSVQTKIGALRFEKTLPTTIHASK